MENWGLITYRENALYHNNASDTVAVKKRVTTYVSHELSHQWFGNLGIIVFININFSFVYLI